MLYQYLDFNHLLLDELSVFSLTLFGQLQLVLQFSALLAYSVRIESQCLQ
jgi:hypothetical protein